MEAAREPRPLASTSEPPGNRGQVEPISEVNDELLDEDVQDNNVDGASDVHGNDDTNDDEAWHDVLSAQRKATKMHKDGAIGQEDHNDARYCLTVMEESMKRKL